MASLNNKNEQMWRTDFVDIPRLLQIPADLRHSDPPPPDSEPT
jgi:hypothetical protein